MKETAVTEKEMQVTKDPWPKTEEELIEYIKSLVEREHEYGTAAYAMSLAATAAFNYIAHVLGTTSFQAGCADADFLRRSRGIKGPFMIIKADDMLYPQYERPAAKAMNFEHDDKVKKWLKEQATTLLKENSHAHSDVAKHWQRLAER